MFLTGNGNHLAKKQVPRNKNFPFVNYRLARAAFHVDECKKISRGQGDPGIIVILPLAAKIHGFSHLFLHQ